MLHLIDDAERLFKKMIKNMRKPLFIDGSVVWIGWLIGPLIRRLRRSGVSSVVHDF